VARKLVAAGFNVRSLVRPHSPRTHLDGLKIEFVEGDMRANLEGTRRRPPASGAECIVYTSSVATPKLREDDSPADETTPLSEKKANNIGLGSRELLRNPEVNPFLDAGQGRELQGPVLGAASRSPYRYAPTLLSESLHPSRP
jgi:hypothetical protein